MKIAYVVNSLGNPGGMERVLCTKVNYFADILNYQVTILVKDNLPNDLFYPFSEKVNFCSFELKEKKYKVKIFTKKQSYKRLIQNYLNTHKQDFVIGMFGFELSFLYKIKDGSIKIQEFHFSKNYLIHLINHLPNSSFRFIRKFKAKLILSKERFYAKKYDALVLLSKKDQILWGKSFDSIVIPNPLSFNTEYKSNLTNKKIIAVGRLIAQKGFDDLIKAFSGIHHEIVGWTLEIFGEGQDYEYLKTLIFNLDLEDKVKIFLPLKGIKEFLINSSIFVFPSRYEGFGLVLTEAMECGLPSVAYDCECGPSEIITHGQDGFLVPLGDFPELGNKLKLLANNFYIREEFSDNALRNVKRFYPEQVMPLWINLFESLNKKVR